MKKFIYTLAIALIVLCTFHIENCMSQWVQTGGPYGGSVTSFAVSGTNLFTGTSGGAYLSTNNGTNWTAVNNGLTNPYVYSYAVS